MNKVGALLRLTRIEHSAMLVIAVIAAEIITKSLPVPSILAASLITPIFISMASFAINDYYDVKSDTLNKRFDRPIVSGAISRNGALYISLTSFAIGVLASVIINEAALLIAVLFGVLAFLYSYRMKDIALLGNAYIAFSMVIPFIYGDFVVSGSLNASIVVISLVIFFSGLAREIHGMIRDYEGDIKARNSRNMVFYTGKKAAALSAFVLYLLAIALSLFLFFYQRPFSYNLAYLIPILAVDAVLLYISVRVMLNTGSRRLMRLARNLSLGAMALALVTYLFSAVVYFAI